MSLLSLRWSLETHPVAVASLSSVADTVRGHNFPRTARRGLHRQRALGRLVARRRELEEQRRPDPVPTYDVTFADSTAQGGTRSLKWPPGRSADAGTARRPVESAQINRLRTRKGSPRSAPCPLSARSASCIRLRRWCPLPTCHWSIFLGRSGRTTPFELTAEAGAGHRGVAMVESRGPRLPGAASSTGATS
jgi:hypothetical protein